MNPRYFIGITLSDDLSSRIASIQEHHLTSREVMQPLVPHITLLDPNMLLELSPVYFIPKVRHIAESHMPLKIKLTSLDTFDKRALYIAVDSDGIFALRKSLIEILPDHIKAKHTISREFVPHITLAQAKPNKKLNNHLIGNIKNEIELLLPQEFNVGSLNSFQWIRPRTYNVKTID